MDFNKKKSVYLTGFMGSGKSTVAPVLAATLNYSYVDTDEEIEKRAGKTVSEIFHQHGEQYFRTIERETLLNICKQDELVVALGGGAIADDEHIQTVKSSGVLVYLKTDVEEIIRRLRGATDRPLLESAGALKLNDDEFRNRVIELLKLREPFYMQADIIIEMNNKKVQSVVEEIVSQMNTYV